MSHSCISLLTSHVTLMNLTANQSRHIPSYHRSPVTSNSGMSPLTSHVTFRHVTANQSCHTHSSILLQNLKFQVFVCAAPPPSPSPISPIHFTNILEQKVYICRCVHTADLDTEVPTDYIAYLQCCFPVTNDNDNTMLLMIMITPYH